MRDWGELDKVTGVALACAFRVSNTLGHGFLEKVYENALAIELEQAGLAVARQVRVDVRYRGHVVGEYVPDMILNDCVVLEIKATQFLDSSHCAQCLNYLRATGNRFGLLLNFGRPRVEYRRLVWGYPKAGQ